MSFALHLSLSEINQWQEQDLELYADFVRRNGLPQDRLEHLLAQIAFVNAASSGAKKISIDDFKIQTDKNERKEPISRRKKGSFLGMTGALPRRRMKR